MAQITLKGTPIHTSGNMPALQSKAPDFTLITQDLKKVTLKDYAGKPIVISTVPSLDTGVCSQMTKQLNEIAKQSPKVLFLTVSADLPFAQARFCKGENVQNVTTLSTMASCDFGKAYGLLIVDGPLAGILARSVLILNEQSQVIYTQLVPEITQEPDYEKIKINILF